MTLTLKANGLTGQQIQMLIDRWPIIHLLSWDQLSNGFVGRQIHHQLINSFIFAVNIIMSLIFIQTLLDLNIFLSCHLYADIFYILL